MFKYEIINEWTHETVFTGYASDVEEVWERHFGGSNPQWPDHYLLVWNKSDLN